MLNALVASTSTEEFIAWLWHDLYKPAFQWVSTSRGFSWYHIPGLGAFANAESIFAKRTSIRLGLVSSHQPGKDRKTKLPIPRKDPLTGHPLPMFQILEEHFISDQGDQVNLGATVNYVQLSIASEPALPTVLVRSVIANAFIEVVTKSVANALHQAFITDGRTPIEQVKFEFNTVFPSDLSPNPDDNEIWDKLGKKFDVQPDSTFLMRHFTPVTTEEHQKVFATSFTADLTGNPSLPQQMLIMLSP
ncbi:MAG: hypothetical protein IPK53_11495 [bacterium]|nr:hypothetical protein [bacterium]